MTEHLCVLIHISNKGEVGTVKYVKPSSNFLTDCFKAMLRFWILFCYLCFMFVFVILSCLFLVAFNCLESADILALLCVLFLVYFGVIVTFPYGLLGQVWYLIVSIPDLCLLAYFE